MKNIRYYVFFLIDKMKGNVKKKHIEDIKRIKKEGDNKKELDLILHYAMEEIPFYSSVKNAKLNEFPVMDKDKINKNFDLIFNKKYDINKLHYTSTSGSTGVPFKTYQNSDKRNRTIGDLISLFSGFDFYTGDKYVFLRSWVKHYGLNKWIQFKQNFLAVDVNTFDDKEKERLRNLLKKDKKVKAIISYSSAMEDFVSYLERMGDDKSMFNVKVIFCSSDRLDDETKKRLSDMFGCTVVNRYSNEECGIMGNTPEHSNIFDLNIASYYFELLELDSDVPVKAGEVGRLVVTDLFNKAMPLIRYDTGDLGISEQNGDNVKTLSCLVGRIADSIKNDNGILITAATLSTYMQEFKYIDKYQLICTENNELNLKVVTKENEFSEIREVIEGVFGKNRKLFIIKVEEIENEKNGKYKQIINNARGMK